MRIRTDGDYAHRLDAIESAMTALDEHTKTAAVIAACEHARRDCKAKQRALAHPDMTLELAEVPTEKDGFTHSDDGFQALAAE